MTARIPKLPVIELANDHPLEIETRTILTKALQRYDPDRWFYTDRVRIERGVIPHSHPVLTLNTQYGRDQEDDLVATYIHEQLHWYWLLADRQDRVDRALETFVALFPDLPIDHPDGCGSPFSTYLHISINALELMAMSTLIGRQHTEAMLLARPYYRAIYALAVREYDRIMLVLDGLGLVPPKAPPARPEFFVPMRHRPSDADS